MHDLSPLPALGEDGLRRAFWKALRRPVERHRGSCSGPPWVSARASPFGSESLE